MSLLDTLPFDITEIIYKISLRDHFKNFHKNFMEFHLKCAQRRMPYRYIKYHLQGLSSKVARLLELNDKSPRDTIHALQNKIYYVHTACMLIEYNSRLLIKNSHTQFLIVANNKKEELFNDMEWS